MTTSSIGAMFDVPRDRWKRPLVIPPDGGKPVPYMRTSSVSKLVDDTFKLGQYQQRMVGIGVAARPDIAAVFATADPEADKEKLNDLTEVAKEAAKASAKANLGTAFHSASVVLDRDPSHVLPQPIAHLAPIYLDLLRDNKITPRAAEMFLVTDEILAAGTADRIVLHDGRLRIADLKTGKWDADYPHSVTIQAAVYAHGVRYNPGTGGRKALPLDTEVALLIHVPVDEPERAAVYELDIVAGWEAALLARRVKDWQSTRKGALTRRLVSR